MVRKIDPKTDPTMIDRHELQKAVERFAQAFCAIHVLRPAPNTKGAIPCPCCGTELRYVVQYNGHLWAKCGTENCVEFLQ
jgi:hypothetical protein